MHHLHIMAKHAVSSFVISFSMSCKFFALLLSLANALVATRLDFNIHKSKKNPRPSIYSTYFYYIDILQSIK